MNILLSIELVPSSSWQNNLRTILKPEMWKFIRNKVIKTHNGKCAICNKVDNLQAHEIWEYDDNNKIQKLLDVLPLCRLCHGVKHIGHSSLKGDSEKFVKHFMKINKCDRLIFQNHLKTEMQKFEVRSHFEWQLDLSELKTIINR